MSSNQREENEQTMRAHRTSHFLQMPEDDPTFPRSEIIRGSDYKTMISKLYKKYIKIGSELEVNMEWATRHDLSDVIASNQWKLNVHYENPIRL